MEQDDGKEFIMVNLVQFNSSTGDAPGYGDRDMKASANWCKRISNLDGKTLLRRAGHPVIAVSQRCRWLSWMPGTHRLNPGWHMRGMIRYRSRRDADPVVRFADPAFAEIHKYKIAAMKQTFAFPMQTRVALYASPRVYGCPAAGAWRRIVAAGFELAHTNLRRGHVDGSRQQSVPQ